MSPDDGCADMLLLRVDLQTIVGGDEPGSSRVPSQSTEQAVTLPPSTGPQVHPTPFLLSYVARHEGSCYQVFVLWHAEK